jgi:hypothetical protein
VLGHKCMISNRVTRIHTRPQYYARFHCLASLQIVFKHDSLFKGQMNHLNAEGGETRDLNPDASFSRRICYNIVDFRICRIVGYCNYRVQLPGPRSRLSIELEAINIDVLPWACQCLGWARSRTYIRFRIIVSGYLSA